MSARVSRRAARALLAVGALAAFVPWAIAETMVEYSAEARFQLDLHVPDAALMAFLPAGWAPNVATQGAAKDANLRAVFIDRVTVNAPDGKPVGSTGSNRLVYLVAPVKDPAGAAVQLVIGGLTEDPADARTLWCLPVGHDSCDAAFHLQQQRLDPRFAGLGICRGNR